MCICYTYSKLQGQPPMLYSTGIEFDLSKRTVSPLDLDTFSIDRAHSERIYWIHCYLEDTNTFAHISSALQLPEHVVALCNQTDGIPKLIDSHDSLTMQVECLISDPETKEINFGNLIIHLAGQFCLTASREHIPAVEHFAKTHPRAIKYAKTPCFILFLVLDDAINSYSEALLELDLQAEQLDLQIRELQDECYDLVVTEEKKVMKIKRYAAAIQDMLMRISGRKLPVISDQCRQSLSNLFDHSQMIVREADAVRDMLKGSLSQIDNVLMRKLNDSMRVLTAFASIFLPLTLIAGIYGMNFSWMPELHWKYGYFLALGMMAVCAGGLLYLFKKNKWF